MLTEERHRFILETLEQRQSIDIHHIMAETGSSESTVRRDLSMLEKQGRLKRVFGGAVAADGEPNDKKDEEQPDGLGTAAARLIQRGSRIFLDADRQLEGMLPLLADQDLTVVTNSLHYANELNGAGANVYMLGGSVNKKGIVSGYAAMDQLRQLEFDVCVLGVDGLTREGGVGVDEPEQAVVKRLIVSRSQNTLVLLDAGTARRKAFVSIPELQDAHIITNLDEQEANGLLPPRQIITYA